LWKGDQTVNKGPVNIKTHYRLAKDTQAKADTIKPTNRQERETKERLEDLAQQHRNVVKTGNPNG
jgi:hypothetical protein